MDMIKLAVQERKESGNGPSRRLRAASIIPGVVYGKGSRSTPVSIKYDDLKAVLAHGQNVVIELELDQQMRAARKVDGNASDAVYVVVKELQFQPLRRTLLHVDLQEVDLAVEIEAPVPIEIVGTPAGVVDGGILDWNQREVTVRALPNNVPQSIELDVSELLIGQTLTVSALASVEGVTVLDESDTVLASLLAPRAEEEEEDLAEEELAEPAEPEVIGAETSEE
ncbi:MAG: 50S ribosomal protein L25 [Thermoleophilia bacterium]|jgi:large subunit ribosomal protein L25